MRADLRGPGLRVLATEEALLTLANGDLADLRFDDVEPDSTARKSGTPRRLRRLIGHPCYTPLASARARHAARPPMADQAAPPPPAPAAPPLVGRERELATLRDALAAALAGRGSLALIGGEAGIGKTTLAEALCREATGQGAVVLVGPCYDLAETPPYGPWIDALERWPAIPELPPRPALLGVADAAGAAETQALRFARLRGALLAAAARRPLVLVLEDLHWADPASLDLLRPLARGLADAPILLLATYRAEEVRREHPLYALRPTLVREARALRLDLRPLSDDDLRALVRVRHVLTSWDEARLVAYLGERAGGNPLFAGELLRALVEAAVLRPAAEGGAGWALSGRRRCRCHPSCGR